MGFKQWLVKFLTPKYTEEVKANLFVQKIRGESIMSRLDKIVKGHQRHIQYDKYRQITPVAWNGKIINWLVFWLGAHPVKSTITFLMILFIAYGYVHDMNVKHDFYDQVLYNFTYQDYICKLNGDYKVNLTTIYDFNVSKYCQIKRGDLIDIGRLEPEEELPKVPMINWTGVVSG